MLVEGYSINEGSQDSGEVGVPHCRLYLLDSWTCIIYLQRGFKLREVAGQWADGA